MSKEEGPYILDSDGLGDRLGNRIVFNSMHLSREVAVKLLNEAWRAGKDSVKSPSLDEFEYIKRHAEVLNNQVTQLTAKLKEAQIQCIADQMNLSDALKHRDVLKRMVENQDRWRLELETKLKDENQHLAYSMQLQDALLAELEYLRGRIK